MTMRGMMRAAARLEIAAAFLAGAAANAAEIKVFASNALKTTLQELAPQFEKASGHKLAFTFNAAAMLKAEIEKGAVFDLAILGAPPVCQAGQARCRSDRDRWSRRRKKETTSARPMVRRALLDAKSIYMSSRAQPASTSRACCSASASRRSRPGPSTAALNPAFAVANGEPRSA